MSNNPYLQYYTNQAGNGMGSFEGHRYQRGKGFFGSILRKAGIPLLKYLGRQVLRTGIDVAGDVIEGEPIKEAFKARAKSKVKDITDDAIKRAIVFKQTGQGRKRKYTSSKKKNKTHNKGLKTNKRRRKSTRAIDHLPLF